MVRTDTCRRGGRWHISRNVEPQQQTSNFSGVEQDACVSLRGPERNLGLRQRSQAETAQFETRRAGQLQIDFAQSRAWIGGEWADRIMYRLEPLIGGRRARGNRRTERMGRRAIGFLTCHAIVLTMSSTRPLSAYRALHGSCSGVFYCLCPFAVLPICIHAKAVKRDADVA